MDPAFLDISGGLDGYTVWLDDERASTHPTWGEAQAAYNRLRAHAAMALESLRHTLEEEEAR